MICNLFVYGTLMSGIDSNIARYLRTNSQFIGAGLMQGRLFDMGNYPGAIYEEDSVHKVQGHIFQLFNPTQSLPILDAYEGIGKQHPLVQSDYIRQLVPVFTAEKCLSCWVYTLICPTEKLTPIPSGNYLTYLKTSLNHQRFIKSV